VNRLHDLFRARGFDLVRFRPQSHWLARRASLLRAFEVDLVVDVGANDGEYGRSLRRLGYRGAIVSFEPLPDAAARLRSNHLRDEHWRSYELALGDAPGSAELYIAGNSASSSLLAMLPSHERYAPGSAYVGRTTVRVTTLDALADDVLGSAVRPFLKIDTQGSEGRVLDGARQCMARFVGVQLELSIEPLYEGAPGYIDMLARVQAEGFTLMSIEPGFSDLETGRMLQFDAVAFRQSTPGGPR
jgi:FkbM family methyltransferase